MCAHNLYISIPFWSCVHGFIYLVKHKFLKKTKWNPPVDMLSMPRMKEVQEIMIKRVWRVCKHLAHAESIEFRLLALWQGLGTRMEEEERKMKVRSWGVEVCRTRVCDATDGYGTESNNSGELQSMYGLFAPVMLWHSLPGKIAVV